MCHTHVLAGGKRTASQRRHVLSCGLAGRAWLLLLLLLQIRVGSNSVVGGDSVASNALCGTIAQGATGGVHTVSCSGGLGLLGRFISVQVGGATTQEHY